MGIISEKEESVLNWLKNNNESYIILDIGANKGFYSESLFKILSDSIETIYAFEPVKKNYDECLKKFNNNNKIHIFNKACSDKSGVIEFYEITSKDVGIEGLSSINFRKVFNNLIHNKINVEAVVIDDFLNIDDDGEMFVKIDTEGHELEVMIGMRKMFESSKFKCLQFEYGDCMLEQGKNLNDILKFLDETKNYKLCDFSITDNEFIDIDENNVNDYINKSWENLFIIRKDG
jgi:FkbM family methyltransferase